MNSAFWARLTIFGTAFLTVLAGSHAIPADVAIYLVAALAGLQAVQHPIQQSSSDNAAASAAVAANKSAS